MSRTVNCAKLGREAEGLDYAPWPGELGKRIYENISKEAWAGWVERMKMIMNEYRLSPADPRTQQILFQQAEQFFFGPGAEAPPEFKPQ